MQFIADSRLNKSTLGWVTLVLGKFGNDLAFLFGKFVIA